MMIATLKVMPVSVDVNLNDLGKEVASIVSSLYPKTQIKIDQQPIAFGLKALIFRFAMPETSSTEELESRVKSLKEVESAEVVDLRRAVG